MDLAGRGAICSVDREFETNSPASHDAVSYGCRVSCSVENSHATKLRSTLVTDGSLRCGPAAPPPGTGHNGPTPEEESRQLLGSSLQSMFRRCEGPESSPKDSERQFEPPERGRWELGGPGPGYG